MKNININVTTEQAKMINKTAQERGFANRSEFFRSLLRYLFYYAPQLLDQLDAVAFEQPPTKNVSAIVSELKKTGRYNKQFIKSLETGLKKTEYFSK